MSLKRIHCFVAIANLGNLNEAAKELNLTPSAVSQNLKLLEEELGVTLIKRTTRSLLLTDVGQYFYQNLQKILADLDNLYSNAGTYNKEPKGELTITCPVAFGYSQLAPLIYEFSERYQHINVNIKLSDNLVNLNEEDYDIALRIVSMPPDNFSLRYLCPIDWVYCASSEYLSRYGKPETIEDLRHHQLLMYPEMNPTLKKMDNSETLKSIKSNCSLFSLQAVLNHKGVAYLPLYLIRDEIKNKRIVPLKLTDRLVFHTHHLYALYFPSRHNNPKIRVFIDFLLEKFSRQSFALEE
ncbi:DNA-binding transcriptional LysR family regulator [Mesocricetibacter intestinalis]|uniref:DNA-binding transcriptional LysR family regulator n=1 Tax=Mesocricetibacter intestinalis TaxID=1521930 RepID=A0A4R6VFE3_9PAST|nr:LysR family transcriptional regulator [Mesocricetibacter intestinalis]TDQ59572.1 DNA-binding transcriptional LysR family regulator [Mesocricetibacter intestinalis]